ncbi:IS66 family transposase, partial [Halorhodospira halophila]|uniref:IS66 family transposase n=1 Tax=Halorhodospira halophila TaxID=1053 RepID=UPI001A91A09F
DAFAGYLNAERQQPGLAWVGCWSHARRHFVEVARQHKELGRVHTVLRLIAALFRLEDRLREQGVTNPEAIRAARQARAVPILARLRGLLERMYTVYPPKSAIGKAVQYCLNHWTGLCRYAEDGRLEPSNNLGERYMRPICVGRANWNFTGSERGGHAMAVLRTIVDTCHANGVNPLTYLRDVLSRIQDHPVNRIDELLPYHWRAPAASA